MEELIDEDKDVARRVLKNFLRCLNRPDEYPVKGYCANCKTEVSFRIQKFVNHVIDEVNHCVKVVESGGEIDPSICSHCGALNIILKPPNCCLAPNYQPRTVAGIAEPHEPWITKDGNLDLDMLVALPVESQLKYRLHHVGREPLNRISWIDYFGEDPAVVLRSYRNSEKRRNAVDVW